MLHLKRNSSKSLITPSVAGRRLNGCSPSSRVVALLLNMPSISAPLQQGVTGTISLLWCASRTFFPRHSKMNLPHESLPMILRPLSTWLDNRLRERRLSHQFVFKPPFSQVPTELLPLSQGSPEPMQLGGTRISPSERDRRMKERCCLCCGLPGYFRSVCPELSGNARSYSGRE